MDRLYSDFANTHTNYLSSIKACLRGQNWPDFERIFSFGIDFRKSFDFVPYLDYMEFMVSSFESAFLYWGVVQRLIIRRFVMAGQIQKKRLATMVG